LFRCTNRDDIDFSNVSQFKAVQEFDLHEDFKGEIEYPTKVAKFNNISNITIYISDNFGGSTTKIYYIGLKGDYTAPLQKGPIITSYESKPQLKDHQMPSDQGMSRQLQ